MNRCLSFVVCLALGLPLLSLCSVARAQYITMVRGFPDAAQRGTLTITQSPEITLNGQPARLSPGARIHDQHDMLVLPAHLTGQTLLVNFVTESLGLVHEVWILTPDEAALPLPSQAPRTYGRPADSTAF